MQAYAGSRQLANRLASDLVQPSREQTMPLARIDLHNGKDAAYREDIGRAVYEALVSGRYAEA
jgi:hypothetical protein